MSEINLNGIRDRVCVGALAIGNFDGVHLGHQELISVVVKSSRISNLEAGVLTE